MCFFRGYFPVPVRHIANKQKNLLFMVVRVFALAKSVGFCRVAGLEFAKNVRFCQVADSHHSENVGFCMGAATLALIACEVRYESEGLSRPALTINFTRAGFLAKLQWQGKSESKNQPHFNQQKNNMNLRIARTFGILSLLVFLGACGNFAPTVAQDTAPIANTGYLLGRFELSTYPRTLFHLRIALLLTEQNTGEKISVEFERDRKSIVLVAVKPGLYRVSGFGFAYATGGITSEKAVPESTPLGASFRIEPGKVYYLADFAGTAGTTRINPMQVRHSWRVASIRPIYERAVAEFQSSFPKLGQLPVLRVFGGEGMAPIELGSSPEQIPATK